MRITYTDRYTSETYTEQVAALVERKCDGSDYGGAIESAARSNELLVELVASLLTKLVKRESLTPADLIDLVGEHGMVAPKIVNEPADS